jgi:hypothetical protein
VRDSLFDEFSERCEVFLKDRHFKVEIELQAAFFEQVSKQYLRI